MTRSYVTPRRLPAPALDAATGKTLWTLSTGRTVTAVWAAPAGHTDPYTAPGAGGAVPGEAPGNARLAGCFVLLPGGGGGPGHNRYGPGVPRAITVLALGSPGPIELYRGNPGP